VKNINYLPHSMKFYCYSTRKVKYPLFIFTDVKYITNYYRYPFCYSSDFLVVPSFPLAKVGLRINVKLLSFGKFTYKLYR